MYQQPDRTNQKATGEAKGKEKQASVLAEPNPLDRANIIPAVSSEPAPLSKTETQLDTYEIREIYEPGGKALSRYGAVMGSHFSRASSQYHPEENHWVLIHGAVRGFTDSHIRDDRGSFAKLFGEITRPESHRHGAVVEEVGSINVDGQVAVTWTPGDFRRCAGIRNWKSGEILDLGIKVKKALGLSESMAHRINDRGQVLGTASNDRYDCRDGVPFVWDGQKVFDLSKALQNPDSDKGTRALCETISRGGKIAGAIERDGIWRAAYWSDDYGQVRNLQLGEDVGRVNEGMSIVRDLNDNGMYVGFYQPQPSKKFDEDSISLADMLAKDVSVPCAWWGGWRYDLKSLPGAYCTQPYAVNAHNVAVGYAVLDNDEFRAVMWDINNGTKIIDLNTLLPEGSDLCLETARSISDGGRILCTARKGKDREITVVLEPHIDTEHRLLTRSKEE